MDKISQSEIAFVRRGLSTGTRLDGREFRQCRRQELQQNKNSQADRSITVRRGHSEITVSIAFRTSPETLERLKIPSPNKEDFYALRSTFMHPTPCYRRIEELLAIQGIGCQIEHTVQEDDGNIFDLFFEALHLLFEKLPVPDHHLREREMELALPRARTFALLEGNCFEDPTGVEEKSADGLVHMFEGAVLFEGECAFSTLEKILG